MFSIWEYLWGAPEPEKPKICSEDLLKVKLKFEIDKLKSHLKYKQTTLLLIYNINPDVIHEFITVY